MKIVQQSYNIAQLQKWDFRNVQNLISLWCQFFVSFNCSLFFTFLQNLKVIAKTEYFDHFPNLYPHACSVQFVQHMHVDNDWESDESTRVFQWLSDSQDFLRIKHSQILNNILDFVFFADFCILGLRSAVGLTQFGHNSHGRS